MCLLTFRLDYLLSTQCRRGDDARRHFALCTLAGSSAARTDDIQSLAYHATARCTLHIQRGEKRGASQVPVSLYNPMYGPTHFALMYVFAPLTFRSPNAHPRTVSQIGFMTARRIAVYSLAVLDLHPGVSLSSSPCFFPCAL